MSEFNQMTTLECRLDAPEGTKNHGHQMWEELDEFRTWIFKKRSEATKSGKYYVDVVGLDTKLDTLMYGMRVLLKKKPTVTVRILTRSENPDDIWMPIRDHIKEIGNWNVVASGKFDWKSSDN